MTISHTTLANGFQIVTEHMPGFQSASVGIWVKVGGRHELVTQNGLAHFLEHMAFKGTGSRTALQIAEQIEDVGGYINAYTSRETTAYYARVLENDVPLAIDILGDILRNSTFDSREIEVERGVILQEIGQALDTPDDVIFDWLQEQAYPDHPLGRTILGPSEIVSNVQQADLRGFVDHHYSPDRMILAAAGAVNHEAIVAQAEALFADMRRGADQSEDAAQFKGGEYRREKDLEQAHIALAFETPGYRDDNIYTAQIYALAMGGGMSSRLFQEVREKHGLCYTIFAQAGAYSDTGMTTIYAGTSGAQIGDLANLTMQEMRKSIGTLTQAELDRARAQMKAGMLMGLESASNRAERLARMVQIWGRVPDIADTVARIDAVLLENLRDFGAGLVTSAPAAMALYGPVANAPTLDQLMEGRAA